MVLKIFNYFFINLFLIIKKNISLCVCDQTLFIGSCDHIRISLTSLPFGGLLVYPLSKENLEIPPCKMKILWFTPLNQSDCAHKLTWHADSIKLHIWHANLAYIESACHVSLCAQSDWFRGVNQRIFIL